MRWIAVNGPIGSGKTSLARALEGTHMLVNYTDVLKEMACRSLYPYRPTTVAEMHTNKEVFRPFILAFGDLINFAGDPKFVLASLREWEQHGRPACVFDNVRSVSQAMTVKAMGFKIVSLQAPLDILQSRRYATEASRSHPIDAPLPNHLVDHYLDASRPLVDLVMQVKAL